MASQRSAQRTLQVSIRAWQLALLCAAMSFGLFRSTLRNWLEHGPDPDRYRRPESGMIEIYNPRGPDGRLPPVIEEHRGCVMPGWRSFDQAEQPQLPPLRDLPGQPAIAP